MNQVECKNLLESIKSDDLVLFTRLVKDRYNLSFGRFPLLSVCYLYNAKSIIKSFELKLCKQLEYVEITELFEIYQLFKSIAGRSLRIYVNDSKVSPLEMLAILHKDSIVRKKFRIFCKDDNVISRLKLIYSINSQKMIITPMSIRISKAPLSNYKKKVYCGSIIIASLMSILMTIAYIVCGCVLGLGTITMPFKIINEKQFFRALNSSGYYVINSDLNINNIKSIKSFKGKINGNNHKIIINSTLNECLIQSNNGEIENFNIIYNFKPEDVEIGSDFSLFVNENLGVLCNVNIECNQLDIVVNDSDDNEVCLSTIAIVNRGTIQNCKINVSGEINSECIANECSFGGVVGKNYSLVENCTFSSNKGIKSSEIDISGIAILNDKNAKIISCNNKANLAQVSSLRGWSPNVAGIALCNYGLIESAINNGNLEVESLNNDEDALGNVFIAGISTTNYGSVIKCFNNGEIVVDSIKLIVYGGGITAYSYYYLDNNQIILPEIVNCISSCNMNVKTQLDNAFVFAGGISGYLYGKINGCFSLSTYTTGYDENKYFIGSCLGSSYVQYQLFQNVICLYDVKNNYMLEQPNILYQIGSLINNGAIVSKGLDAGSSEIANVFDENELKEQELYWYE